VLLIGAYELRFCPHLPWRVVINEGVELSKMFGAEDGHRYVNGVLDKLAKSLRQVEIEAAGQESP
jgi:N utilization substance protein B